MHVSFFSAFALTKQGKAITVNTRCRLSSVVSMLGRVTLVTLVKFKKKLRKKEGYAWLLFVWSYCVMIHFVHVNITPKCSFISYIKLG